MGDKLDQLERAVREQPEQREKEHYQAEDSHRDPLNLGDPFFKLHKVTPPTLKLALPVNRNL